MTDTDYMKIALSLAEKGMGFVNPNPMVGAVIVRDGEIIGRGFHEKFGGLHAERNAFADCDSKNIDCKNADLYVTLEPCCHYGKTPPCTEAIIEHGIKRVFIGSADPNPLVAGKGVKILREHGIEVFENILRDECDRLNEIFLYYITNKKPFVTLKYAMTADGKICCYTGKSKWITGESARQNVHRDRLRHSAIMTGVGTVLADDPLLTCRIPESRNPVRIICDSNLRTPLDSQIVRTAGEVRTIIATVCDNVKKISEYKGRGCEVLLTPEKNSHVDLNFLLEKLAEKNIDSVFLECGGELAWSALESGIVNKVQAYIAPKIFGGISAKSPVGGAGVPEPSGAYSLEFTGVKNFDNDILLESRVIQKNVHWNN